MAAECGTIGDEATALLLGCVSSPEPARMAAACLDVFPYLPVLIPAAPGSALGVLTGLDDGLAAIVRSLTWRCSEIQSSKQVECGFFGEPVSLDQNPERHARTWIGSAARRFSSTVFWAIGGARPGFASGVRSATVASPNAAESEEKSASTHGPGSERNRSPRRGFASPPLAGTCGPL